MNAATPTLAWRPAENEDIEALQAFECAHPVKPARATVANNWTAWHPRRWEYDAQCAIRALEPPSRQGLHMWLGEDADGVGGVSSWEDLEGPGFVHLDVLGIANRHRRSGGDVAREAMRSVLGEIERRALEAGEPEMYVEGEIYRENGPSLAMVANFGFTMLGEHPTGAQTWALRYPLNPLAQS